MKNKYVLAQYLILLPCKQLSCYASWQKPSLHDLLAPFVQMERAPARGYYDAGPGMAMIRRLLDQMGGNMSVESTEAEGTTKHVVLSSNLQRHGKRA